MNHYKALILDLDNCLYPYEPCNKAGIDIVIKKLQSLTGKKKQELIQLYQQAREDTKKYTEKTASSHSRLLYIQKLTELIYKKTDIKLITALHENFWKAYIKKIVLYEGVLDILRYLKENNIQIAIVTDLTTDIQMKKLLKTGLNEYITYLVTSEESGQDKPHPDNFYLTLKKLNLKKEEVLMIGDDGKKDIKGAEAYGIKAILAQPELFKNGKLKQYF